MLYLSTGMDTCETSLLCLFVFYYTYGLLKCRTCCDPIFGLGLGYSMYLLSNCWSLDMLHTVRAGKTGTTQKYLCRGCACNKNKGYSLAKRWVIRNSPNGMFGDYYEYIFLYLYGLKCNICNCAFDQGVRNNKRYWNTVFGSICNLCRFTLGSRKNIYITLNNEFIDVFKYKVNEWCKGNVSYIHKLKNEVTMKYDKLKLFPLRAPTAYRKIAHLSMMYSSYINFGAKIHYFRTVAEIKKRNYFVQLLELIDAWCLARNLQHPRLIYLDAIKNNLPLCAYKNKLTKEEEDKVYHFLHNEEIEYSNAIQDIINDIGFSNFRAWYTEFEHDHFASYCADIPDWVPSNGSYYNQGMLELYFHESKFNYKNAHEHYSNHKAIMMNYLNDTFKERMLYTIPFQLDIDHSLIKRKNNMRVALFFRTFVYPLLYIRGFSADLAYWIAGEFFCYEKPNWHRDNYRNPLYSTSVFLPLCTNKGCCNIVGYDYTASDKYKFFSDRLYHDFPEPEWFAEVVVEANRFCNYCFFAPGKKNDLYHKKILHPLKKLFYLGSLIEDTYSNNNEDNFLFAHFHTRNGALIEYIRSLEELDIWGFNF